MALQRRHWALTAAMKPSVLYYCAIALVVLGSVVFGLDWQPAVLPAMAPIKVVALPPPPPPPVKTASPVETPAPPVQAMPAPPPAAPPRVWPAAPVVANPPAAPTPPKPLCDVAACAAAYHSFRESDCTYNPSVGPRRLCTKGVVPAEATAAPIVPPDAPPNVPLGVPSIANPEPGTPEAAQTTPEIKSDTACNVSACAAAYRSFRESDCTFNPNYGPRQHCTK